MATDKRKKILVVDDSKIERELLIEILKGFGITNDFFLAENGEKAIEILELYYRQICLILLDWKMPGMSGLELMEAIMKTSPLSNIPIVMITIYGSAQHKMQARQVNPALAGYIVKPYSVEALTKEIKTYLE